MLIEYCGESHRNISDHEESHRVNNLCPPSPGFRLASISRLFFDAINCVASITHAAFRPITSGFQRGLTLLFSVESTAARDSVEPGRRHSLERGLGVDVIMLQ